ncbi:MAG: hypothetical protein AAF667_03160 [Pseudomonadota bacterium]
MPVTSDADAVDPEVGTFDLILIGTGIAGLNALYAATYYLPKGARVLLIDEKDGAGGMWTVAYDFVRLHQPHGMFTVGDLRWNWQKPSDYLAARDEVRNHLEAALAVVMEKFRVSVRFGHVATSCEEVSTSEGWKARVAYHPTGQPNSTATAMADLAIHASGLNYQIPEPLALSSDRVVSIRPQDLTEALQNRPDAAVCVVGGGKTGMDTVTSLLDENPVREIVLLKGKGTNFFSRDKYFPTGMKRWSQGQVVSRVFHDMATHFDGDNEDALIDHFRQHHSVDGSPDNRLFVFGILSEAEKARIERGATAIIGDYLSDVRDTANGPEMVLRSGATRQVADGTIVVNCTGTVFRTATVSDAGSCVSPHDTILTIAPHRSVHVLTSVGGFFLTHLHFRGRLRSSGMYVLDQSALFLANRMAWVGAACAQSYLNQVLAVQTLPFLLLNQCGLDMDRWHPFPRRAIAFAKLKLGAKKDIAHCQRALDRVAERFDAHCRPVA